MLPQNGCWGWRRGVHTVTAASHGQAKAKVGERGEGSMESFHTHGKSTSVLILSVQCSVHLFKLLPFWSRSHKLTKLAVLPGNNKDTMHFSSAFHQIIPTYFTNRIKEASQHPCEVGGNSYTHFTGGENRHWEVKWLSQQVRSRAGNKSKIIILGPLL